MTTIDGAKVRAGRRSDGRLVLTLYVMETLGDGPMLGDAVGPRTVIEAVLSAEDERAVLEAMRRG